MLSNSDSTSNLELPQIGENWILERFQSRAGSNYIRDGFKFILGVDELGKGYVRFGYNHNFHNEIKTPAKTIRGGGHIKLENFNPEKIEEHYTILFFGESTEFGKFDRNLLEKIIQEHKSEKFSYKIEA